MPTEQPPFSLLESPNWRDYELLDSGGGLKLERFGPYIFSRPESQAMWRRALPEKNWSAAHASFQPTAEESGGHWIAQKKVPERWKMEYALTPVPSPEVRERGAEGGVRAYSICQRSGIFFCAIQCPPLSSAVGWKEACAADQFFSGRARRHRACDSGRENMYGPKRSSFRPSPESSSS